MKQEEIIFLDILHIIPDFRPSSGGAPKAVLDMCTGLVQAGHDVTIYTANLVDERMGALPDGSVRMVQGIKVMYFGVSLIQKYPISASMFKAIRKNAKLFDIVHLHQIYNFHLWDTARFCQQEGIPFVISPHGSLDPYLRNKGKFHKWFFHKLLMDRVINAADAIHYTAEDEKKLAHEQLGYTSPTMIVPLGLHLEEFAELPTKGTFWKLYPELSDRPYILFLGRINFKKGLDLLAKSFGVVSKKFPEARLVIVGPEDPGFGNQVRTWLSENHVIDKTLFTGMLHGKDKLAAYVDAEVFVLPSYSENFGITLVEAMACGKPVITTDKVNIWREINSANAGTIVHCEVDELVVALERYLGDRDYGSCIGSKGKALVDERFNWNNISFIIVEEYKRILRLREEMLGR